MPYSGKTTRIPRKGHKKENKTKIPARHNPPPPPPPTTTITTTTTKRKKERKRRIKKIFDYLTEINVFGKLSFVVTFWVFLVYPLLTSFLTDDVLTFCLRVFAEVEVRERRRRGRGRGGGGVVEREGRGLSSPSLPLHVLVLFIY